MGIGERGTMERGGLRRFRDSWVTSETARRLREITPNKCGTFFRFNPSGGCLRPKVYYKHIHSTLNFYITPYLPKCVSRNGCTIHDPSKNSSDHLDSSLNLRNSHGNWLSFLKPSRPRNCLNESVQSSPNTYGLWTTDGDILMSTHCLLITANTAQMPISYPRRKMLKATKYYPSQTPSCV